MEELVSRISAATGLEAGVTEKAIGMVLAFLSKEGPSEEVGKLLAAIPGADALIAQAGESGSGGGLMGMLGGMGGGVMALGTKLMGAGLGMGQVQTLGKELFAYGRETVGEDVMGQIVAAVPGLGQFV